MTQENVREIALELLIRIQKQGSFSHLIISDTINKSRIETVDENLLTEIVYGTIERSLTLDYYLAPFITKQKKLQNWVIQLLKMSMYQMVYLEKVPEYAVINEAVNIAKKRGHKGIASLVNGVLRNIQRKGLPNLAEIEDDVERLALQTSHPTWLVERWIKHYGLETTRAMCETNIARKPLVIRVNPLKSTRDEVMEELTEQGISSRLCKLTKHGIIIEEGNIFKTDLLKEGHITVQDTSSMLAVEYLDVAADMNVLDSCSAPGGKATYTGELMHNTGTIHAVDLHENKLRLINRNAKRLGLTNIEVQANDARNLADEYANDTFDRIIIDAPCSGLGVIRSKPDIKYQKEMKDIEKLHTVQTEILESVAPLLKENGKLVYSTCTVEVLENEEVIKLFLQHNAAFKVDETFLEEVKTTFSDNARITAYGLQLFPHTVDSDGFFISRLVRVKE